MLNMEQTGSTLCLVNKGTELSKWFRLQISQELLVVLGNASNFKMLLCQKLKTSVVLSPQKRKAEIGFSPGINRAEVK